MLSPAEIERADVHLASCEECVEALQFAMQDEPEEAPETLTYRFGSYRIDSGERLLRRSGELIPLPPKAIDTLLVLVAGAGRMVDKGDLMQSVWPDTFVEEGGLTRNISLLRKALGDTKEEGGYIETIPKRGYRFVAEVQTDPPKIAAQAPIDQVPGERVNMPAARQSVLSKWGAEPPATCCWQQSWRWGRT